MDLHICDFIPCDFVMILFLSFIIVIDFNSFFNLLIIMYILDIKDFKKKNGYPICIACKFFF